MTVPPSIDAKQETIQQEMEHEIEEFVIEDHTPEEIEQKAKQLNNQIMVIRKERKAARYLLYRLRTEAESNGENFAPDEANNSFKRTYMDQELFDGWLNFSVTWDVALANPKRIVHRDKSQSDEWEELVAAKYPMIEPGGKVIYPNETVKKRLQEEIRADGDNNIQQDTD
jgi:hypothetical protein